MDRVIACGAHVKYMFIKGCLYIFRSRISSIFNRKCQYCRPVPNLHPLALFNAQIRRLVTLPLPIVTRSISTAPFP
jgi:hypothetical protein